MPAPIENYTPQIIAAKMRGQAFYVWSFFAFLAAIWLFLIIIAPLAAANNLINISQPIYKFFSFLCHQIPNRSLAVGDHAFAVCSRCFGVYCGLFFGFIIYPFARPIEETAPLPRVWLFLAMIPMGADFLLGFFEIWENTHLSRFLTGAILGTACAIFIVPALIEIFQLLSSKTKIKRLSR